MIHQAQILFKARAHVIGVAGPGDVLGPEVGDPAGHGDIAQVAPAVDEDGPGNMAASRPR